MASHNNNSKKDAYLFVIQPVRVPHGCGGNSVIRCALVLSILIVAIKTVRTTRHQEYFEALLRHVDDAPTILANGSREQQLISRTLTSSSATLSDSCQAIYNTSNFSQQCHTNFYDNKNNGDNVCQRLSDPTVFGNNLWLEHKAQRQKLLLDTNATTATLSPPPTFCKTIWVSGLGMGFEDTSTALVSQFAYQSMYAAALKSAQVQGLTDSLLQPVLVLLIPPQQQEKSNTSTITSTVSQQQQRHILKFIAWAESQGVIVLTIHELSFQDLIFQAYPDYRLKSALSYYLRLDMTKILQKHRTKLWKNDTSILCLHDDNFGLDDQVVFYTDLDVLFVNPIPYKEFHYLKSQLSSKRFLMYGQDYWMHRPKASNTGVIFIHLQGWETAFEERILPWGRMLLEQHVMELNGTAVAKKNPTGKGWWFPPHDQFWLNYYYMNPRLSRSDNLVLPPTWNWKVYWEMENHVNGEDEDTIYIVHFHGPKPDKGMREMAVCDLDAIEVPLQSNKAYNFPESYQGLLASSICCDRGRASHKLLQLYNQWKPTEKQVQQWWL